MSSPIRLFDELEAHRVAVDVGDAGGGAGDVVEIFVRRSRGEGPPLLLLHGFPETHLMWRDVVPRLAREFTIVCADLPGYGQSGCPTPAAHHDAHSKRAFARILVRLMARLGFDRFGVAGHDRGGRVAYRMALDHPTVVSRVAVLDIIPTAEVWDRADANVALGFWPWSLLAQPAPLPERLLLGAPDAIVDHALGGWGSSSTAFEADVRAAYVEALRDPDRVHAICEEYRAAAAIDREHDDDDRRAGRRIGCPLLAVWSASGPLGQWYAKDGGPIEIWKRWADRVTGVPMNAGHFFPEEMPDRTADILSDFFGARTAHAG